MRRIGMLLLGGLMASAATGCTLTHELQPHRLWRWNRGAGASSNPYFSISDPLPSSALRRTGTDTLGFENDGRAIDAVADAE